MRLTVRQLTDDQKSLTMLINYGYNFNRGIVANDSDAGTYPIQLCIVPLWQRYIF